MAIDANVLINERVREELRAGNSPQAAITAGYERAWATILDSNVTTMIAGIALLIFGSGPVRGFAVVHCLGILTSIFSSVVVSRAVINLIYGRRKKLTALSIGQVWKPNRRPRSKRKGKKKQMEFFRIRKDIPFMRHALVFNVISLITFLLAVFFLAHKGLHFSVEFTGGTLMEMRYTQAPDLENLRKKLESDGFSDPQVQNFGSSTDVLIRVPLAKDGDSNKVSERVLTSLQTVDSRQSA